MEHGQVGVGSGCRRRVEQPCREFDANDPRYSIVDAAYRNAPGLDVVDGGSNELHPIIWHHGEVDPVVDGLRTVPVSTAGELADRVPVADDQAVESKSALEDVGHKMPVAMHLAPTLARRRIGEARIAHHDGLNVRPERTVIAGRVRADEIGFAGACLALVDTVERAAIADEMLRCCQYRCR